MPEPTHCAALKRAEDGPCETCGAPDDAEHHFLAGPWPLHHPFLGRPLEVCGHPLGEHDSAGCVECSFGGSEGWEHEPVPAIRCETCGGKQILYSSRKTGRMVGERPQVEGLVKDCPDPDCILGWKVLA